MQTSKNLARLNKLIHHNINSYHQKHPIKDCQDLSRSATGIIIYLNDHKNENVYQKDIEKEFSIRKSTASSVLTNLEEKGYIQRLPVRDDKRLNKLVLTEKSDTILNSVRKCEKSIDSKLYKDLTEDEINDFCRILSKMIQNMEEQ